jgi:hypothetical protein
LTREEGGEHYKIPEAEKLDRCCRSFTLYRIHSGIRVEVQIRIQIDIPIRTAVGIKKQGNHNKNTADNQTGKV